VATGEIWRAEINRPHLPALPCTGFSNRRSPKTAPKNGAISGAEVPGLVPFSFPRIVTVSPLFALVEPRGTGRRIRGKIRGPETPSPPWDFRGFDDTHRVFSGCQKPKSPPACGLSYVECGRVPVSATCIDDLVDTCIRCVSQETKNGDSRTFSAPCDCSC
jgi:hypothetical protein